MDKKLSNLTILIDFNRLPFEGNYDLDSKEWVFYCPRFKGFETSVKDLKDAPREISRQLWAGLSYELKYWIDEQEKETKEGATDVK